MKTLIDTNIYIQYFSGEKKTLKYFEPQISRCFYSIISSIEIFSIPLSSIQRIEIKQFLLDHTLILVDEEIADQAATLRLENKGLKTPDAIILATALHNDLELASDDSYLKKLHQSYRLKHENKSTEET